MTAALDPNVRHHTDKQITQHLQRTHAALFDTYDLKDVVRYIEEKTYLSGEKFSFKNHEFQQDILSDTSRDVNVQKCAQVGLTEAMARYGVGTCRIMPYFSVIMTMPFAGDATQFAKTRLDPFINESPDLRESMDCNLDNSEIKAIGTSLLYLRGCNGTTAALSVPADMLIHDEVDRSDPHTLAQYQSRLKHSRWKLTRKFGTPTADKIGIAAEMACSLRKHHMVKCHHCNHQFVPNYHSHVHIPGFDRDKREINKHNLHTLRWEEAVVLCPRCGLEPSMQPEHRSWVVENPDSPYTAVGYYVIPFSVPNIVTPASLVRESTVYNSWSEFVNQALGETSTDNNLQLIEQDIEQCKFTGSLVSSEVHCLGIDVGQICHIAVGRITLAGELLVIHKERCVLAQLSERKLALKARFKCLITVIDVFPETEMVQRMQAIDKNLYGGIYHENRKQATYEIQMVDKNLKEGKLPVNLARIIRDLNFDELMHLFKTRRILWATTDEAEDNLFKAHCTDMTRKQDWDKNQELIFRWVKSKEGHDHYMHALGYLHVACKLMPTANREIPLSNFAIAHRIKIPSAKETRIYGRLRN